MHIGQKLLAKHEGIVQEFEVITILGDQLKLSNGKIEILRFFWEVRMIPNDWKKEEK